MRHSHRKARLEALLLRFQPLWRPQPFKVETPDWSAEHPALAAELLALDDAEVEHIGSDNEALIRLLSRHVPEAGELSELIRLPHAAPPTTKEAESECLFTDIPGRKAESERLFTDIPGRKQAQIEAYAAALGEPRAPLLEWCSGKGHLGRLLAHRWHRPVASLEIDTALCDAGTELARRAKLEDRQRFIPADALAPESVRHLSGRHAIALHACGDLHVRLVEAGIEQGSPAIDFAPCCYYRTVHDSYRPFGETELELNRDDLRLAVTETVTASPRQQRLSRRALAWKLGWVELRKELTGEGDYRSFPPVPEAWLKGTFEEFVERMLERAPFVIPAQAGIQSNLAGLPPARERRNIYARFEALGQARAARMLRLQLVRFAFRRPLEIWLVMDMAIHLERHGYRVGVSQFCKHGLTPRNLLLSARKM